MFFGYLEMVNLKNRQICSWTEITTEVEHSIAAAAAAQKLRALSSL
jgi:hypothetical protein